MLGPVPAPEPAQEAKATSHSPAQPETMPDPGVQQLSFSAVQPRSQLFSRSAVPPATPAPGQLPTEKWRPALLQVPTSLGFTFTEALLGRPWQDGDAKRFCNYLQQGNVPMWLREPPPPENMSWLLSSFGHNGDCHIYHEVPQFAKQQASNLLTICLEWPSCAAVQQSGAVVPWLPALVSWLQLVVAGTAPHLTYLAHAAARGISTFKWMGSGTEEHLVACQGDHIVPYTTHIAMVLAPASAPDLESLV